MSHTWLAEVPLLKVRLLAPKERSSANSTLIPELIIIVTISGEESQQGDALIILKVHDLPVNPFHTQMTDISASDSTQHMA